jgi:SAM-dependent methyltransferase
MSQPTTEESVLHDARKVILNLGWMSAAKGRLTQMFPPQEWREIRYDCDARMQPDLIGRLDRLDGVADHSIDVVYAPQLIQRFPLSVVPLILREAFRVLKDEGRLVVSVPNAQIAATYFANNQPLHSLYETKLGSITPLDLLYGLRSGIAQGEAHYQHRSGYTHEHLGVLLRDIGFTNISVQRKGFEITAVGFKFPYDHPERVERISMGPPSEVENAKPPSLPPTQAEINSAPLRGKSGLGDDLDLPPGLWKPLGLR